MIFWFMFLILTAVFQFSTYYYFFIQCLYLLFLFYFFFFNQKTAYCLRISYWSSDVCSSDLIGIVIGELGHPHRLDDLVEFRVAPALPVARCLALAGLGHIVRMPAIEEEGQVGVAAPGLDRPAHRRFIVAHRHLVAENVGHRPCRLLHSSHGPLLGDIGARPVTCAVRAGIRG